MLLARINSLNSNSKPSNAPSKCFNPIESGEVNITNDVATFYIQDTNNKTVSTACLDEDSLDIYKTSNDYVFYRCKDTVKNSALFIGENDIHPIEYRLLNFDRRIYVKDSEAHKLEVGKHYILRPTNEPLGRIASHDVVFGSGMVVSAKHCGPADGSMIYKIYEVNSSPSGGRRKTRRRYRGSRK